MPHSTHFTCYMDFDWCLQSDAMANCPQKNHKTTAMQVLVPIILGLVLDRIGIPLAVIGVTCIQVAAQVLQLQSTYACQLAWIVMFPLQVQWTPPPPPPPPPPGGKGGGRRRQRSVQP